MWCVFWPVLRKSLTANGGFGILPQMRRDAKRDANEDTIVDTFVALGCTVKKISDASGFPDLVVLIDGATDKLALVEVKMPGEHLTSRQKIFHRWWPGKIHIAYTESDAVTIYRYYKGFL